VGVVDVLRRGLQAAGLRHRVLSDNISNADTPGFKRSDVRFSEALKEAVAARQGMAMVTTSVMHLQGQAGRLGQVRAVVVPGGATSQRPDGNNVDIEREMAELTKNTLFFDALSQQIHKKMSLLRTAVNEGRR
jgi:flagellar basal-body rod protein FlgB